LSAGKTIRYVVSGGGSGGGGGAAADVVVVIPWRWRTSLLFLLCGLGQNLLLLLVVQLLLLGRVATLPLLLPIVLVVDDIEAGREAIPG
jgi:hypothetical protein